MQKLVVIFRDGETMNAMLEKYSTHGVIFGPLEDGRIVAMMYPYHHHVRREMGAEDGVAMLPGMHDPTPIGDLHAHFTHVDAKPEHTARDVALKLHVAHGDQFHPDT